ncbi:hypothetical protein GALMADRAFT_143953 [Galerina marginata CBS 339.88]|uniref:DUF6534 domain-containing protein n=1 Tax=Galerina marginata (strain CBS 339.88) TaxID=685588 RepID=A0A067SWV0_GALM3|nr:hypothetical protein GALMADRAFT_143953 [Galerina marginata CBS 339.88]
MAPAPVTPADLGKIAGPLLIAYLLNWGLFGVLSMQVYLYHLAFPGDRAGFKVLVYGTYLWEAVQTFLLTTSAFMTFATGFTNPMALDTIGTIWFSVPIMVGFVAFVSQVFYAYRIIILSQNRYIVGIILLLSCLSFSASIALGVETKNAVLFSHYLKKKNLITSGIWEGGSAGCDVMIAASMTYLLKRHDTRVKPTQVLLKRIIRLTIETGSLTAAVAILSHILGLLPGKLTYYQTSVAVLGKLYSNSMMASLNSRMQVRPSSDTSVSAFESEFQAVFNSTKKDLGIEVELGNRSVEGRILVTREEVSFPQSNKMSEEKKKDLDDLSQVAQPNKLPTW